MFPQFRPLSHALVALAACLALACGGGESSGDDDDDSARDGGGAFDPDGGAPRDDAGGDPAPSARRIIGYFTAWSVYGRDYHVADIPADRLTHVNYAFANISAEGECVLGDPYADIDKAYPGDTWEEGALRGSFNQLRQLKQAHPHLRTLISVGGWTWSGRFSDVALTADARARFAASCVEFMAEYGFDGIDIDWEYPVGGGLAGNTTRPEDRENYTLLLAELRARLDERGAADERHYLLTIAAPAGPGIYANIELAEVAEILDWINLMSYDFHGAWSPITNFNAPLYASSTDPSADPQIRTSFNAHAAVAGYLDAGVPAGKLVLGVPFYGRGWQGVPAAGDGLYQPHTGASPGTWEAGVLDYHDIAANYLPASTRRVHDEARVPWLYDPATGVMISYDDPESLAVKAEYVRERGLGGVMFWELSGDDADRNLAGALHDTLNP